ncbi:MAG TPA: helix-turn-helix domain-containing protein [Ktedonobacteraceae bacterium]
MARTPRIVEDRREQIIDAAMRVFAEKGFARATNRDIAQEAGITTGLIYYYFKSKEDLFSAILEERSPLQVIAQMPPEMLEMPPETFLPLLIMRILSVIESERFVGLIRVLLPEMLHGTPTVAPLVMNFFQRALDFIGNYLQRQVEIGTVRADLDVLSTAQMLASSMIGTVLRRQILRDPGMLRYTQEEIAQFIPRLFLQGIQRG